MSRTNIICLSQLLHEVCNVIVHFSKKNLKQLHVDYIIILRESKTDIYSEALNLQVIDFGSKGG